MKKNTRRPIQKPEESAEKPLFPMRINKYLAMQHIATRREADTLISKRKVTINGRLAVLGDKVNEGDEVKVQRSAIRNDYVYYAYYKPIGVITHSPQVGEKDVLTSSNLRGVFPIGRLDKNSHGLMILTNDGRVTDKLLNPDNDHEKEYVVTVKEKLRPSFKQYAEEGINLGDYTTKPAKVKILNEHTFVITLTEGKKHQIRRMCEAMRNEVKDLKRTRIMNISLGKLAPNSYRKIEDEELEILLQSINML